MKRAGQIVLVVSFMAFCWLAMQAVHEAGHIAAAIITGTEIIRVVLHPLAISETEVWEPVHPLVVVWAGPIAGTAIPLVLFLVAARLRMPYVYLIRFFAGFCLIANGVYIGFGPTTGGADTAVMWENGTPFLVRLFFGIPAAAMGLYLWHGQGIHFGLGNVEGKVE